MREEKLYKLDWETAEVKLAKGRFTHTFRRPDADLIFEREDELQAEIPIGKDGSYSLGDPTANEEVDARYYDKLIISATGYPNDHVPEMHKAAAFQGLYVREIAVDEDAEIFADEVPVLEEIGRGAVPDFTVRHIMRQPTETEIKSYRRKTNLMTEVKSGKRGKQILVSRSNLRMTMQFYASWLVRVEGGSVGGEEFTADNRTAFLQTIDPLIQRKVVQEFASEISSQLLD